MLSTVEQTSAWAKFRESAKKEPFWLINVEKEGKTLCRGTVAKMKLPFGKSWLYCNRGPVFDDLSEEKLKEFVSKVKEIAFKENAVFLRIEPPFEASTDLGKKFLKIAKKAKFRAAHASHQPEYTLVIDLTKNEEEILAQMKQKGRYNVRLAEKKGVKIVETDLTNSQEIRQNSEKFYKILQETTSRDEFKGHDEDFYRHMIEILGQQNMAQLYLAEYDGETIAGIIVSFYKDTATYYYGASSDKYRNVMAPYLLQWHAIKEAKKRGMKLYDFLGIAPPEAKNHPWAGVTEFKMKFGGTIKKYVKAQEYVFSHLWYWPIVLYKKLLKR